MGRANSKTLWLVLSIALGLPVLACLGFCGFGTILGAVSPAAPTAAPVVSTPEPSSEVAEPDAPPVDPEPEALGLREVLAHRSTDDSDPADESSPSAPAAPEGATDELEESAVTPEQIRMAHSLYNALAEDLEGDEEAITRRVAHRLGVTRAELVEAHMLVAADPHLLREMARQYNVSHGISDPR